MKDRSYEPCPQGRGGQLCVWELRHLPAPKPETVGDLLRDQNTSREFRGKRLVDVCRRCRRERVS